MKRIGIDAGGSLVKVAYEENGKMHLKTYSSHRMDEVTHWLKTVSPEAIFYVTGGRSHQLKLDSNRIISIPEFEAVIEGTKYILQEERKLPNESYLLVNIGTGTSIFYEGNRLSGTGIGGGLFTGLGKLIANEDNYRSLIDLARHGDRTNSDLMVSDIYDTGSSPIEAKLTASNFGKANFSTASKEDHIAALIQLIGENILLLSNAAASSVNTEHIVFIGGTLTRNQPLKDVLTSFQEQMNYHPIFLDKGGHVGAIGALISS